MLIGLLIMLGAYIFMCYCTKLICVKCNVEPGVFIWIPILQLIPMYQAAGMHWACIILAFVPIVNIFVWVYWAFAITKARGKPTWWGIAMLIPLVNIAFFLYLAFSE